MTSNGISIGELVTSQVTSQIVKNKNEFDTRLDLYSNAPTPVHSVCGPILSDGRCINFPRLERLVY